MQLIIPGLKTAYCLWALCLPLPLSLSLSLSFISRPPPSSSFSCKLKATSVPISWEGSKQRCRNYPLQNWSKQSQSGTARKSRRMKLGESVTFLNLLYHWERVWLHCLQGMSMAELTILFFLGLYSLHTVIVQNFKPTFFSENWLHQIAQDYVILKLHTPNYVNDQFTQKSLFFASSKLNIIVFLSLSSWNIHWSGITFCAGPPFVTKTALIHRGVDSNATLKVYCGI